MEISNCYLNVFKILNIYFTSLKIVVVCKKKILIKYIQINKTNFLKSNAGDYSYSYKVSSL